MWLLLACAPPPPLLPTLPNPDLELPRGRWTRWADLPLAASFTWPVVEPSRVNQGYGARRHLGLDVNARGACDDDLGVEVVASAPGEVTFAEDLQRGWGNVVLVAHRRPEGLAQTLYAHLDRVDVVPGDLVRQGQVLGTMGNAGGVYCAHLHFEVRSDPTAPIGAGYGDPPWWQLDPTTVVDAPR